MEVKYEESQLSDQKEFVTDRAQLHIRARNQTQKWNESNTVTLPANSTTVFANMKFRGHCSDRRSER